MWWNRTSVQTLLSELESINAKNALYDIKAQQNMIYIVLYLFVLVWRKGKIFFDRFSVQEINVTNYGSDTEHETKLKKNRRNRWKYTKDENSYCYFFVLKMIQIKRIYDSFVHKLVPPRIIDPLILVWVTFSE